MFSLRGTTTSRDPRPWSRVGVRAAVGWSLLATVGALLSDGGWVLPTGFAVAAAGLAAMAWAMLTDRLPIHRRRPVLALSWTVALTLLLVLPSNLIMRLAFLEPGAVGMGAFSVVGGVCWAWAALAYQRHTGTGCSRCGRSTSPPETRSGQSVTPPSPLQRGVTVGAALIPVVGFTVPHWLWALGLPFGTVNADDLQESHASALWVLGLLPLIGAGLTLGLIRPWGQLFPGWIPILGGRRVPRWLAVVPSALVGLMLAQYGAMMTRCTGATLVHVTDACYGYGRDYFTRNWAFTGTYPVFLFWGSTLLAAAVAYFLATRPVCTACGLR